LRAIHELQNQFAPFFQSRRPHDESVISETMGNGSKRAHAAGATTIPRVTKEPLEIAAP